MRHRITAIGLGLALALGLSQMASAQGQCPDFTARGALKVETDPEVLENFRLPIFQWKECSGAASYQIFINDNYIDSVENATTWQPTSELAFGSYKAFIVAVFGDSTTLNSSITQFRIGIMPPTDLTPNHKDPNMAIWDMTPELTFRGSKGAMGYALILVRKTGEKEMKTWDLSTPEGRDGAEIKTYNFPISDADKLSPDEEISWRVSAWTVIDGQKTNIVESEKASIRIYKLNPPTNLTPVNGFSVVVRNSVQIPELSWTHELIEKGEQVDLELYFMNESNKTGVPNPATDTRVTEANAMTQKWRDPELLETGEYRWYVVAKKEGQEAVGQVWNFTLKEPLGLTIGIKAGGNGLRTTNALSKLRIQPGGGLYVDQRIKRWGKFQLMAQLDVLLESRSVGFNQADNPEFIVEDLHISNLTLCPGLFIKPLYRLKENLDLYGLVGVEPSFVVSSRIINTQAKKKVIEQTPNFGFNLVYAAGATYTFDVKYIAKRPLQLGAEIRFTHGLIEWLEPSFLGAEGSLQTEWQVYITNKIIDF